MASHSLYDDLQYYGLVWSAPLEVCELKGFSSAPPLFLFPLSSTHHIFRKFALGEVVISYQHHHQQKQRHHHLASLSLSPSPVHSPIHTHIHCANPIPIPILIQATQQIWIWIQWAGLAAQPTSDKVASDAICKGSMWASMEKRGGRRGNCYNSWRHCLRDKTQNSTSFSQEICQPFSSLLLGTWHNGDNMEISAEGGLQTNWEREGQRRRGGGLVVNASVAVSLNAKSATL